jgi:molybdopterin/thiamine biosynthesis adenylyltransferase
LDRYDRQRRVRNGVSLDDLWSKTSILLVGVGGVGSPLAQMLHRSGIGKLTLVDGDRVRISDLHRQVLYDEKDAREGTPKVTAAARALVAGGGRCVIETHETMLTPRNAELLFRDHDLVIDATDHIAVRSLIQKISLQTGIGWIHSAAIADRWVAASFHPPGSPCYHCWVDPQLDQFPLGTCETEGVLPAACFAAASAVMRLLTETFLETPQKTPGLPPTRRLLRGSVSAGESWVELEADPSCPTCSDSASQTSRQSEEGSLAYPFRRLCGSGSLETWINEDLDHIEAGLRQRNERDRFSRSPWALRIEEPSGVIICYEDGRALITGDLANDEAEAKERLAQILEG